MTTTQENGVLTFESAFGGAIEIEDEGSGSDADTYIRTGVHGASLSKAEVYEFIVALAQHAGIGVEAYSEDGIFIDRPEGAAGFAFLTLDT